MLYQTIIRHHLALQVDRCDQGYRVSPADDTFAVPGAYTAVLPTFERALCQAELFLADHDDRCATLFPEDYWQYIPPIWEIERCVLKTRKVIYDGVAYHCRIQKDPTRVVNGQLTYQVVLYTSSIILPIDYGFTTLEEAVRVMNYFYKRAISGESDDNSGAKAAPGT